MLSGYNDWQQYVEEQSKQAANGVVAKLRAWWSHDKVASDELERFKDEPDMYRPVIEARLVKKLTAEPDMQREFEALLTEISPQVEVFQKIAAANGVTGARIEELVRGHVRVEQQIDTAENVTGAEIKRLG